MRGGRRRGGSGRVGGSIGDILEYGMKERKREIRTSSQSGDADAWANWGSRLRGS